MKMSEIWEELEMIKNFTAYGDEDLLNELTESELKLKIMSEGREAHKRVLALQDKVEKHHLENKENMRRDLEFWSNWELQKKQ